MGDVILAPFRRRRASDATPEVLALRRLAKQQSVALRIGTASAADLAATVTALTHARLAAEDDRVERRMRPRDADVIPLHRQEPR